MIRTFRVLLANASLVVATLPALAGDRLPPALHGHWCADGLGSDRVTLLYAKKRGARCPPEDSDDDNSIRITPGGLVWGGTAVKVIYVEAGRRTEWFVRVKHGAKTHDDYSFALSPKRYADRVV